MWYGRNSRQLTDLRAVNHRAAPLITFGDVLWSPGLGKYSGKVTVLLFRAMEEASKKASRNTS